ncbi:MAG: methyltransferase domain-containing protein [Candidatus Hydrogenedentota bacterium]
MKPREYVTMRAVEDWHWWYEGLRGVLKHHWNRYVSKENPVILDVGCGTGANMVLLENDGRCFGLDRSSKAIAFCRERGLKKIALASAGSLPYPSDTFDAAVSLDVLVHKWIQDKQAALDEMARILKPGGYLFLNLSAYQWLRSSHDVAVEQDWRTRAAEIRQMLNASGLEVERITYWNTLLFPAIAAVRLVRKCTRNQSERSDFRHTQRTPLDFVCAGALRLERCLLPWTSLPFGLSVFAVASKPLTER